MKKENEKMNELFEQFDRLKQTDKFIEEFRVNLIHYRNMLANVKRLEDLAKWQVENCTNKDYFRGQVDMCYKILTDANYYTQEQLKSSGWGTPNGQGSLM